MEKIKVTTATGINEKIAVFGCTTKEGRTAYFLGWLSQYAGPRSETYATEGAIYNGTYIYEIPEVIADLVVTVAAGHRPEGYPDDIAAAGRIVGICDALAYPENNAFDAFENIVMFY